MTPHAVMVGPPGAGKSTIGRKLAGALGTGVCDTDAEIEARTGRRIPDIFSEDGEQAFRAIEEDVVRAVLGDCEGVVSLGGGAILSPWTRARLREHTVVYLDISANEGLLRTGIAGRHRARGKSGKAGKDGKDSKDDDVRPLLRGPDPAGRYRALLAERRPLYEEVATLVVHTDRRSPGKVVQEIAAALGGPVGGSPTSGGVGTAATETHPGGHS